MSKVHATSINYHSVHLEGETFLDANHRLQFCFGSVRYNSSSLSIDEEFSIATSALFTRKNILSIAGIFESQDLNAFRAGNAALYKQNVLFQKTSSLISSTAKLTLAFLATDSNAEP